MFSRLANGWELAKESFHVLRLDKELLIFPLLSGLACLAVLASFALPIWDSRYAEMVLNDQRAPEDPIAYLLLFAFYFANYFVIVFFNSALVACAVIRLQGNNPTLGDGFRAAADRLPQILGWALVCATVGVVLKVIESRSERAGKIAAGLLGMAWSISTYFVVPVLVVERAGLIHATKRSLSILRKTWGEALSANFGIGIITFLLCLPLIALMIGGFVAISAGQTALGAVLASLGVLSLLLLSLVSSAVNAIILAALYVYAATGEVPRHFDPSLLDHAFEWK